MRPVIRKPGQGWQYVANSVWLHEPSGIRLHLLGIVRFPSGKYKSTNEWPTSAIADGYIRMAGGNHKRGLMMWALAMLAIDCTVEKLAP